jgi:signal transduction histidine kinase
MPVQLQEQGLDKILEKTVDRWNNGEGFKIRYSSQLISRYPLRTEAALYRIVLELLHNIKKHAEASEVSIEIWEDAKMNKLTLLVEDNGKGFDKTKEEGIGWKSIRQRVQYMNGKVNLDSSHLGSTVIIDISLEKENR